MMGTAAALATLALTGCSADPKLEIRSVGLAAQRAPAGDEIALGRGALAIGNVGLALEQYRAASRTRPGSIEALAGIALCYDELGRADLARRYYEEALALAPANISLLRQYAASLARHGAAAEAQAVVAEIALRTRSPVTQWVIEPSPRTVAEASPPAPVAVAAAPAPSATVATVSPTRGMIAPAPVVPPQPVAIAEDTPPRPVARKIRLERLSLGEIALVTSGAPIWTRLPSPKPASSVRLLNAARRQGLAARNREQLAEAGWRRVAIGDADRIRWSSLILYPEAQRRLAQRLGQTLRIAALRSEARADIVILLGRDRG